MERGRFPLSKEVRHVTIAQKLRLPDQFEKGVKIALFAENTESDMCDFAYFAVNQLKCISESKYDLNAT